MKNSDVAVSDEGEKPPPLEWSGSVILHSKYFKNISLEGNQNAKSNYPL